MLFELVKYHAHGAMDSINLIDLPAFKVVEGPTVEGQPKEPDTLFVIDGTRKESYYVEAHPGTAQGQYTPA